ncbi:MAG: heavy metal translocating P-type ATPase [Aestuariivirga sp.]
MADEVDRSKFNARVEELRHDARNLADGTVNYVVSAPAIHCGLCISTIEKALSQLPGVTAVRANLSLRRVSVTLVDSDQSPAPFVESLERLGYSPQSLDEGNSTKDDRELKTLVRSLAVSGFAAANVMLLSVSVWSGAGPATTEVFHYLSALIAIPTVAYSGQVFFRSAAGALKHRRVNMDVPISLGIILATVMSLYESFMGAGHAYFDAAVSLIFFLLIGRTLDHVMRNKARNAVQSLARLSAKGGLVVLPDGSTSYQMLDAIRAGMILRVTPGERVPVDGTVVHGSSDVDRALVTGESAPIAVTKGSALEAGILNLTGSVDIRADRQAKDSFLAEILQMMQAAESGQGHYVRMADRMARLYAPCVHVMALASFIGWMIMTSGDWHQSITVAISVLIITCPCALGLAVPVAHVIAASRLSSIGVLMKDGSALERLAEIDEVAFDKTGTLTTNLAVIDSTGIPPGKLAQVAKALCMRSVHPAAKALARSIGELPYQNIDDLREIPGFGVEGLIDGRLARLGRTAWVAEIAVKTQGELPLEGLGFAMAGGPAFFLHLSEELRAGSVGTVASFKAIDIPATILSGDAAKSVSAVADLLGIEFFKGGLRPGDKLSYLQECVAHGHKVLMVGDGLNDAPALAAANVSIAPASASDTGRQAADFVFTRDNLDAVWNAYRLAKSAQRIVKENFGLAILYNVVAVPLAVSGALNPLIAAVAMSSSSILVVANSMRLYLVNARSSSAVKPARVGKILTARDKAA